MNYKPTTFKSLTFGLIVFFSIQSFAQDLTAIGEKTDSLSKSSIRAKNIIMIGAGSSLLNDKKIIPEIENFIQIQYKRFLTPNLNINGNLKKFDIEDYSFETEGFLSGDLNLEWYVFPNNKLTPYLFIGAGILTSNDFNDQNYKVQGGLGLDYLITNSIAITGSIETNYVYDEQNGSLLMQGVNELYFNALIGLNFYIGSKTSKSSSKKIDDNNQTSTINSNLIGMN